MDPKLLFQLSEIIDLGSMSRAAKRLNVTQPTLSRNIRIIEDRVGAPVLRRGRYGVTATEIGENLAQQGRDIRSLMDRADGMVDHWRSGLSGELRIGVGPMLTASVMPAFFAKTLTAKWPYALHVIAGPASLLITRLNENAIDMALAPSQMNLHQEDLMQEEIFFDEIAIFAGPKSPLANHKGKVGIDELRNRKWIASGAFSGIHGNYKEVLNSIGLDNEVNALTFSGDIFSPIEILKSSDALAALPKRLMRFVPNLGGVKELQTDFPMPSRSIAIWLSKANRDKPNILHLQDELRNYFASLDGE